MEQTITRMPDKLKALLREDAKTKGISLNAQILSILWEWYGNQPIAEATAKE